MAIPSSHQKRRGILKFELCGSYVFLFVCLAMSLLSKPIKSMKTNVNDVNVIAMGAYTYVYVDY